MSAAHFPKILAFVEGQMERLFINENFRYVDVVTLGNGASVTIDNICKQIRSKFNIKKNNNISGVIVWFDKDKRTNFDYDDVILKIKDCFKDDPRFGNKIAVLIPDQMSENIILSDEFLMIEKFKFENYSYTNDGKNGKHILREYFKLCGENYSPTYHGCMLLKKIRLRRISNNQPIERFLKDLTFIQDCWWLSSE